MVTKLRTLLLLINVSAEGRRENLVLVPSPQPHRRDGALFKQRRGSQKGLFRHLNVTSKNNPLWLL